ncbi:hypothetical protein [Gordonia caeni]|uniref:Alpha galactosidase C-terminal domain-containing protein n=1 Tax=Gordonia caeni TaxID=1007097 RepID=A0ABP7P2D9_9ACTN
MIALRRALSCLVAMVLGAVVLAGCADEIPETATAEVPPVLGVEVGGVDPCATTTEQIRAQADALVGRGLREAGYTALLVPCDEPVPAVDDVALRDELAGDGLTVERVSVDDERVAHTIPAGVAPEVLRTAITRRVMLAWPLVFSGDVARLPDENIALIGNREVLDLALDDKRRPGAPVGDDQDVYSRAIGEVGLLVSLTRRGDQPGEMSVSIADLNLAGADSVPATDIWTGRRLHSVDGSLSVPLAPGDTALLTIG